MREARKDDLAVVIGNYHADGIVGQVVEVVSDPEHHDVLYCVGCPNFHYPHGRCNLVTLHGIRGWIPTRWLVPFPPEDAAREREAEKEVAA